MQLTALRATADAGRSAAEGVQVRSEATTIFRNQSAAGRVFQLYEVGKTNNSFNTRRMASPLAGIFDACRSRGPDCWSDGWDVMGIMPHLDWRLRTDLHLRLRCCSSYHPSRPVATKRDVLFVRHRPRTHRGGYRYTYDELRTAFRCPCGRSIPNRRRV